jgi:SAM-dependent methyltransferase
MKQEEIFSATEADAWFYRNKNALLSKKKEQDTIYLKIAEIIPELKIKRILEIGCSNGYRLDWFAKEFDIKCIGIEPSKAAVEDGIQRYKSTNNVKLIHSKVDESFWQNEVFQILGSNSFDLIIFGHCFYLISPELYFSVVMQADRILDKAGIVAIFDFDSYPQKRKYHHYEKQDLWSYKMDFSRLFTSHPMYKLVYKKYTHYDQGISLGDPHNDCSLAMIRKINKDNAFIQIKN